MNINIKAGLYTLLFLLVFVLLFIVVYSYPSQAAIGLLIISFSVVAISTFAIIKHKLIIKDNLKKNRSL